MKALVLAREGRRVILLLPGGEMRTVRAKKGWQTGMEVNVKPYPLRRNRMKINPRAALYPLAVCAAAFLIVFAGLRLLGTNHVDHQHPVQPLSSGSPSAAQTNPSELAATVAATPQPTPMPAQTAVPAEATPQAVQPTPVNREICEECGEAGHDDNDCPDQVCEECGGKGHDDDDCPKKDHDSHHGDRG